MCLIVFPFIPEQLTHPTPAGLVSSGGTTASGTSDESSSGQEGEAEGEEESATDDECVDGSALACKSDVSTCSALIPKDLNIQPLNIYRMYGPPHAMRN